MAALDRDTGDLLWKWKSPLLRRGYVSLLLLDAERLIASVNGYTYCLDPLSGTQLWYNGLAGFGTGVTSIAAVDRHNPHDVLVAAAAANEESAAAGNTTATTTAGTAAIG